MKTWVQLLLCLSVFHITGCKANVTTKIENEVIIIGPMYEKPVKADLTPLPIHFNNSYSISKSENNNQPDPIEVGVENTTLISVLNSTDPIVNPIFEKIPNVTTENPDSEPVQEIEKSAITVSTPSASNLGQDFKNINDSQKEITENENFTSSRMTPSTIGQSTSWRFSNTTRGTPSSTVTPSSISNQVDPEVILLRQKIKNQENEKQMLIENVNERIESKDESINNLKEQIQSNNEAIENMNEEIQRKNEAIENKNEQIHSRNEEIENMNKQIQSKDEAIENMNKQIQNKDEAMDKMAKRHQKAIDAIKKAVDEIIKGKDELMGQMEKTIRSKDETIKKTEESSKIQREFETFKLDQCESTLASLNAHYLHLKTTPEECNVDVTEFQKNMKDLSSNIAMKIEEVQNMTSQTDECVCEEFSTLSSPSSPMFSAFINLTDNLLLSEKDFLKTEKLLPVFSDGSNTTNIQDEKVNITNNFTRVWVWMDWCSWYELEMDEGSADLCQFGMGSNEFYSGPGAEVQDCSVFLAVGGVMGSLLVVASIMMCILALRLRKVTKQQKRRKLEEVMRDHRRRYGLEPGGGGVYRGEP